MPTVTVAESATDGAALSNAGLGRAVANVTIADVLLALLMTCLALVEVIRPGQPVNVSATVLTAAGAGCLAWRRHAPMVVFGISASAYCLYQLVGHPHPALPFPALVAVYTLASGSRVIASGVASCVLMTGYLAADVRRGGWPPDDLDDALFAYFLSVFAACGLGYAVKLSRARTNLLREQAALLASEHAAHEEQVLQAEQARIARELHDVIAHQVSVITALAAGAKRVFTSEPELAREALNSIEGAGREALTEMRRLLRVLRSDADGVDLCPQPGLEQLPALIANAESVGLPVRLTVQGQPRPVPAGVEMCAYRIAQEALTNTFKHAGPSRATIQVTYRPTLLELHICDDGRGMRDGAGAGHGLIGMHERAALVRGRLVVGAGPQGGVQVSVWLPTGADQP